MNVINDVNDNKIGPNDAYTLVTLQIGIWNQLCSPQELYVEFFSKLIIDNPNKIKLFLNNVNILGHQKSTMRLTLFITITSQFDVLFEKYGI